MRMDSLHIYLITVHKYAKGVVNNAEAWLKVSNQVTENHNLGLTVVEQLWHIKVKGTTT